MKKKFSKKIIYIIILSLTLGFGMAYYGDMIFPDTRSEEELIILHTNDEHGTIDNFGQIAYKKQELEKEYKDVLLVSAGDIFGGNPVVDQYRIDGEDLRGLPIVELMNSAGYDVLTIGNHEFDYGQERLQDVIEKASFPFILANVEVDSAAEIEQPPSYVTMETPVGRKVSFLGLLQLGRGGIPSTHPDHLEGLSFVSPYRSADEYLPFSEETDLSVALTHLGYSNDLELARRFSELDLIIGGHSHQVITEPEVVNDVYLTQAGANTEYLGKIKVHYEEEEIDDISGKMIPIEEIEGTVSEIERDIKSFYAEMEEEMETVLHYFPYSLQGEEALGSLMTDALVNVHGLDFAFQHDGGIRLNELPREVRMKDVYELDPFNNNIVIRRMTPEEIKNLIFSSFIRYNNIDLRVSGLNYTVQVDETGSVIQIQLWDEKGHRLNEGQEYRVGMNSYLARSYYSDFPVERERVLETHTTCDALIEFLHSWIMDTDYSKEKRTDISVKRSGKQPEEEKLINLSFSLSTSGKRNKQVTAGELMADAAKNVVDADIGTYPSDQLKSDLTLSPGPLYEGILEIFYDSFSYDNTIFLIELSGKELKRLFLSQAKWYKGTYPLQVSQETEYEVLKEEGPIKEVQIFHDGKRVKANKLYTVAINSFKFEYYREEVELENFTDSGVTEKETLINSF